MKMHISYVFENTSVVALQRRKKKRKFHYLRKFRLMGSTNRHKAKPSTLTKDEKSPA